MTDNIQPARVAAAELQAALRDQETGLRGYLISADRQFLAPYYDGQRDEQAAAAEVRRRIGFPPGADRGSGRDREGGCLLAGELRRAAYRERGAQRSQRRHQCHRRTRQGRIRPYTRPFRRSRTRTLAIGPGARRRRAPARRRLARPGADRHGRGVLRHGDTAGTADPVRGHPSAAIAGRGMPADHPGPLRRSHHAAATPDGHSTYRDGRGRHAAADRGRARSGPGRPGRSWTSRRSNCGAPTPNSSSSPTSRRTICRNPCERSPRSVSCSRSDTATNSTSAVSNTSVSRWTAPNVCRCSSTIC